MLAVDTALCAELLGKPGWRACQPGGSATNLTTHSSQIQPPPYFAGGLALEPALETEPFLVVSPSAQPAPSLLLPSLMLARAMAATGRCISIHPQGAGAS